MDNKQAAYILDPVTTRQALASYAYDPAHRIQVVEEACRVAVRALRPVSREQVERIWFRESYSRLETWQGDDGSIVYSAVNTCMACGHETPIGNFCHNCGAAQTAEGVELTMKRLEVLKDGKGV